MQEEFNRNINSLAQWIGGAIGSAAQAWRTREWSSCMTLTTTCS